MTLPSNPQSPTELNYREAGNFAWNAMEITFEIKEMRKKSNPAWSLRPVGFACVCPQGRTYHARQDPWLSVLTDSDLC